MVTHTSRRTNNRIIRFNRNFSFHLTYLFQFHFINRPNGVRLDDDQVRKCKMKRVETRPGRERKRERESAARISLCKRCSLTKGRELVEFTGGRYEV